MIDEIGQITKFDSSQISTVAVLMVVLVFVFGARSWVRISIVAWVAISSQNVDTHSLLLNLHAAQEHHGWSHGADRRADQERLAHPLPGPRRRRRAALPAVLLAAPVRQGARVYPQRHPAGEHGGDPEQES